jgi:hypothetical protein
MDDLLLIAGMACFVWPAWLTDERLGLVVLGVALVLVSFAFRGVKIPRPRLKIRRRR